MTPTTEEAAQKLARLYVSWSEAMKEEAYERASFLANDLVEAAVQLRRRTFAHLDEVTNASTSTPPKPSEGA